MDCTTPGAHYLTRKEAAAIARVSLRTIDRWREIGKLPPGNRIDPADLDAACRGIERGRE